MLLEQVRIEQCVIALDELVEALRRPALAVGCDAPHPSVRDRRVKLVRGAVGSCHLPDRIGDEHEGPLRIVVLEIPPGELEVLPVTKTITSSQDLVEDRVAAHRCSEGYAN